VHVLSEDLQIPFRSTSLGAKTRSFFYDYLPNIANKIKKKTFYRPPIRFRWRVLCLNDNRRGSLVSMYIKYIYTLSTVGVQAIVLAYTYTSNCPIYIYILYIYIDRTFNKTLDFPEHCIKLELK
jgi:hypothetical protein